MLTYDFATGEVVSPSGRVLGVYLTVDEACDVWGTLTGKNIKVALDESREVW